MNISFPSIKAVIFDVDGTLYDQPKLRRRMFRDLASNLICSPVSGMKAIIVLAVFRRIRDQLHELGVYDIKHMQYELVAKRLRSSPDFVQHVVKEWMFNRPLRHLPECKSAGLDDFIEFLDGQGIMRATFSDYPAEQKLNALHVEVAVSLDAEDPRVDRLKPDPKGLVFCAKLMGLDVLECLFIGDRVERDGECARRAGMPYLLVNSRENGPIAFTSYVQLLERLRYQA